MSAKIITFGISKGGCSKSTTSGITSWLLSEDSKVLAIDMDSQGNLTAFLSGEYDVAGVFEEKTVLEAIMEGDASPYITGINENLDLLPSNDYLSGLSRLMTKNKMPMNSLTKALQPVMDDYDYIIIDTPPNLGEQTIASLTTNSEGVNHAVIMFDGSMFAYYAIQKYLQIMGGVYKNYNVNVKFVGIAFAIVDSVSKEYDAMKQLTDKNYPEKRFNTIIKRRAATRRLPLNGFEDNDEIKNALEFYKPFVKELVERVQEK